MYFPRFCHNFPIFSLYFPYISIFSPIFCLFFLFFFGKGLTLWPLIFLVFYFFSHKNASKWTHWIYVFVCMCIHVGHGANEYSRGLTIVTYTIRRGFPLKIHENHHIFIHIYLMFSLKNMDKVNVMTSICVYFIIFDNGYMYKQSLTTCKFVLW